MEENMRTVSKKNSNVRMTSILIMALLVLSSSVFTKDLDFQENVANEKLFNEIAGNFEFEYEGQIIVFEFIVEDGKLMAAPEGEVKEALEVVEGKEMSFSAFTPDGMELQFTFARDDEGKITKCTIEAPSMGIVVEGSRIK
jgi:hypothetical protein